MTIPLCQVCKKSIEENVLRVAYDGKGINRKNPKTWVPLHTNEFSIVNSTLCSLVYDIEFDKDVGFFDMSIEEYQASLEGKIPEKYNRYLV